MHSLQRRICKIKETTIDTDIGKLPSQFFQRDTTYPFDIESVSRKLLLTKQINESTLKLGTFDS